VELPENVTDASQQVANRCNASGGQFVVTGQGGLPSTPVGQLASDRPWSDLRDLSSFSGLTSAPIANPELTEATHWQMNDQGQMTLVASRPIAIQAAATCAGH
jgi:large exoprotein involved in heme utilization and adhesion